MSDTTQTPPAKAPDVKGGVVAYLTVDGASKAADFYRRAFGAEIAAAMPQDEQGRTMHIHLYLNGSSLMLSDAFPEHGHALQVPAGFTMMLPVDDIEPWWTRAVEAGAEVVTPYQTMFWGDVYGQLRDPFGVIWAMNQGARPSEAQ